jgi:ubiquinone/menaquinone biosynthesis C-methylase UbiE
MTTTTIDPLDAVKQRQQATWASGDYSAVAALIVPVAERLVDLADLRAGSRVLDVATGSANAAIAAARLHCEVVGIDYVEALLDRGRERAAAEGLEIDLRAGDAEHLPFSDSSFDASLSVFGSMFAPNHDRTAREIVRVTRTGGTIALASWMPDGFLGALFRVVAEFVPPPPGVASPMLWGSADHVGSLFGPDVSWTHTTETFTFRFPTAEAFVGYFAEHYGPTLKAIAAAGSRAEELRSALTELVRTWNRLDQHGPVAIPATYLASVGVKEPYPADRASLAHTVTT